LSRNTTETQLEVSQHSSVVPETGSSDRFLAAVLLNQKLLHQSVCACEAEVGHDQREPIQDNAGNAYGFHMGDSQDCS